MDANAAVDAVYRSDWGRIVATLIRLVGDFDLAEEAAQEAFAVAVDRWRASGVPQFPRAWIIETARNKAIDHIRRRTRFSFPQPPWRSVWCVPNERSATPAFLTRSRTPTTCPTVSTQFSR